jgi:hypothetical protein
VCHHVVTCREVRVTKITGSRSDLLTLRLQVLLIILNYNAIADIHNLQITAAHAVGFSVFTSRLLATDPNIETITSNHYEAHSPLSSGLNCTNLRYNRSSLYWLTTRHVIATQLDHWRSLLPSNEI